jgi:hypothetical protein
MSVENRNGSSARDGSRTAATAVTPTFPSSGTSFPDVDVGLGPAGTPFASGCSALNSNRNLAAISVVSVAELP